ncbi:MAG: efflux RND transporter periplasmic adaptor subunit [Pirellulales bacterium]
MASSHDREGVLQPYQDIDVATTEVGIIREILVKAGDRVIEGQPLAVLDSEVLRAQIRVKETEALSKGRIEQALAELKLQEKKLSRLLKMKQEGNVNSLEIERAEADVLIAKGRLTTEEDQSQVQMLELERFKKNLEERTIRAPISGIVTEIFKNVGEFVATNSPNIVRIVDNHRLKTTFAMMETDLNGIEVGHEMKIQLSNGRVVPGIVEFVPPVADAATGWFMVTVVLDNSDEKIIASKCQRLP